LSDNHIGISLGFMRGVTDLAHRVYGHNMTILGSTPASVCGASTTCRSYGPGVSAATTTGAGCFSLVGSSFRRVGILSSVMTLVGKICEANGKLPVCRPPNTPVKECVMPWEKRIGSLGARYSETHWSSIAFGFFHDHDCGQPSVGVTYNPTSKDFSFPSYFSDVRWLPSAHARARVFLGAYGGARVTDDAVSQLSIVDVDGSFIGTQHRGGSVVPIVNPAQASASCETRHAYYACPTFKLRMLKWEAVKTAQARVLGSMKLWRESDSQATWST